MPEFARDARQTIADDLLLYLSETELMDDPIWNPKLREWARLVQKRLRRGLNRKDQKRLLKIVEEALIEVASEAIDD